MHFEIFHLATKFHKHCVICTPKNFNSRELNLIKQIALNNGYIPTIIDGMLLRRQKKTAIYLAYPSENKNEYISLTCVDGLSEKTCSIFHLEI